MDGLSPAEQEDFFDPVHLLAQIQLCRITGNVLGDVYRIPQPGRANTLVQCSFLIMSVLTPRKICSRGTKDINKLASVSRIFASTAEAET